jgi:hypothetical protein
MKAGTAALAVAATHDFRLAEAATCDLRLAKAQAETAAAPMLEALPYRDVTLTSELHERQLRDTMAVVMSLDEDSLLRPMRAMAGRLRVRRLAAGTNTTRTTTRRRATQGSRRGTPLGSGCRA